MANRESRIFSMYVVNKSGGLIYNKVGSAQASLIRNHIVDGCVALFCMCKHHTCRVLTLLLPQDFTEVARVDLNDTLRLASIW